jgi:hypothetical protein
MVNHPPPSKTSSIMDDVSNYHHYDLIITVAALWLVSMMLLKRVQCIELIDRSDLFLSLEIVS